MSALQRGTKPYDLTEMGVKETNELKEMVEDVLDGYTEEVPAEEEPNGPETKNGVVCNSLFVKVRKEPSLESDVLDTVREGSAVKILGVERGFHKIQLLSSNKITGYIFSAYIKEE